MASPKTRDRVVHCVGGAVKVPGKGPGHRDKLIIQSSSERSSCLPKANSLIIGRARNQVKFAQLGYGIHTPLCLLDKVVRDLIYTWVSWGIQVISKGLLSFFTFCCLLVYRKFTFKKMVLIRYTSSKNQMAFISFSLISYIKLIVQLRKA